MITRDLNTKQDVCAADAVTRGKFCAMFTIWGKSVGKRYR